MRSSIMSSLPDIIRMFKSGGVKLIEGVASMEEKRNAYEVWYENL
jgi:hypothetical protein